MPSLIHGEPSLAVVSDLTRLWITLRGGQIAPVEFTLDPATGRTVSPYSLAPWQPADFNDDIPVLLRVLRGDFFCFPFGITENVPHPHGPPANCAWSVERTAPGVAEMSLRSTQPPALLRKRLELRPGQTALYQEHLISEAEGDFNYGHHPILYFPEGVTAEIRLSAWRLGRVYPGRFADPSIGERSSLRPGATINARYEVATDDGGVTSLARFPARSDRVDLVMFSAADPGLAWTAVTYPDFVWIALRRAEDFPSTVLWLSNGGRSAPPWQSRHTRRLGIEDVCSHFHDGAHLSARDLLATEGVRTSRRFRRDETVSLRHIQAVVPTPANFGGVARAQFSADRTRLELIAESGARASAPLDGNFLFPSA
jgi:hypothetical protein